MRHAHLIAGLAFAVATTPALGAPALWKASDADSHVWLFGSIHIMPAEQDWRTPLFDKILVKAARVYFETDMSPEQQALIGAEAFARGVYTDGTLLTDVLDDKQEALLRSVAADNDIALGPILAMRPWMATQMLTGPIMIQSGFIGEGVELQVMREVAADKLGFFETGSQQLDVLATGAEDSAVAMLMQALEDMPTMSASLKDMLRMWLDGDSDELHDMMMRETVGIDGLADRLLFTRNTNWLGPIEAMLADNESSLIIVGAAHLTGEEGVPALLARAGYTLERIQ